MNPELANISFTVAGRSYQADLSRGESIAISLLPNGEQPSHFAAPACQSETLVAGDFVGDTRRGGSCNVNQLTIIPHCNGTHTESVSHIVDKLLPVYQAIEQPLFITALISISPEIAKQVNDSYLPDFDDDNHVITRSQLEQALAGFEPDSLSGLVIRTLPNSATKQSACYDSNLYPPYLTNDAMRFINELGIAHLLVDFPSVDKMYDDGHLSNHRIFWQVASGSSEMSAKTLTQKTITEMVYVAPEINDGLYLCDLQVPQINTDAVPSRPLLYPLTNNE